LVHSHSTASTRSMAKSVALLLVLTVLSVTATTVEEVALAGGCATVAVKGLSEQLIDEMNCLESGLMKSIDGHSKITIGSSAFPFLQNKAADALFKVVASGSSTLSSLQMEEPWSLWNYCCCCSWKI